eukprot:TRINITY_DN11921_c0_g1_i1.p1 TRINITY_DN11921_c0_g1~~TRINITY_DN11921_c0_g1_i1.p1  ORF type:complete len:304 (-),score=93.71 TRINITY_DN11921_c0_g1_i1:191-1102(-)
MVPDHYGFQQALTYNEQATIGPVLDPEVATLLDLVKQVFSSYRTETSQNHQNQSSPAIKNLKAYTSTEQGQSLLTSLHQSLEADLKVWLPQLRQQFQDLKPPPTHTLYQEYQQKEQLLSQLEQQQQQQLLQQLQQQQQQQQEQQPQLLPLTQAMIQQLLLHHEQQEQMHSYSPPPALTQSRRRALPQMEQEQQKKIQPLSQTMVQQPLVAHHLEEAMVQWPPVSKWMTGQTFNAFESYKKFESELQIALLQLQLRNRQLQSSLPQLVQEFRQNEQLLLQLEQQQQQQSQQMQQPGTSCSSTFH